MLSIIIHVHAPHLGGIHVDVQYNLSTLEFNNGDQIECFHSRIIILQQQIILYKETFSPTRLIFWYIQTLSKSDKLKAFIAPKITYLATFLDNNVKSAVYTGGNIRGTYRYL